MNTEKIRIHYVFHGNVQGVGFRYKACYSAKNRGVTGWVRNCWDETVEMEVQGDEETITEMIKRIRTSSYIEITDAKWTKIPLESDEHSWGCIDSIDSENIPVEGGYGFEIR